MEKIGRHVYQALKRKPNLTDEERKQIEVFENGGRVVTEEQKKANREYAEKLRIKEEQAKQPIPSKEAIGRSFMNMYKLVNGRKWVINEDTKNNLGPIIAYFAKDPDFYKFPTVSEKSVPSLDKGLLVIGGYGNGKTSIFLTLQRMFQWHKELSFKMQNANKLVELYESCEDQGMKTSFWYSANRGRALFDDVKAEREASNYGKSNLMQEIIEKRYMSKTITHFTCNYKDKFDGDLDAGLKEFGEKYGGRSYDRLFEMCNIIQFQGKSMRR